MDTKTQNLINDLAGKHQKKPFWKSFNVLLSLWLVLNLGIFTFEMITAKSLILNYSYLLLAINILAALLSWVYFSINLNRSVNKKWDWIYLASLIGLVGLGFGVDFFAGHFLFHFYKILFSSKALLDYYFYFRPYFSIGDDGNGIEMS
jgi:hypothetical protein